MNILSCPFCGNPSPRTEITITDTSIRCGTCSAKMVQEIPQYATGEECLNVLIELWNSRAFSSPNLREDMLDEFRYSMETLRPKKYACLGCGYYGTKWTTVVNGAGSSDP